MNAEKTYGRWAFIELNQNDFTLDGLTSDEALLENCREAYENALGVVASETMWDVAFLKVEKELCCHK